MIGRASRRRPTPEVEELEPRHTPAEVGPAFRISNMGPDGDTAFRAQRSAVAYNSINDEYLIVWWGTDDVAPREHEIYGQRLDAASGVRLGSDFRISDMGPAGSTSYGAFEPAVAYNSANNEYLVVWYGEDDVSPLVNDEPEIFGQRLSAASGAEIGTNDFRISDMGPNGSTSYEAFEPAVAYNSTNNEYLVVWWGDDNTAGLVDNEYEIFGQRLGGGNGFALGTNDFRISDMGPNGNTNFVATTPAVAYDSVNNQYLVVWSGDDGTVPLVDDEAEIFGQRLNAIDGSPVGANDFRISDMGPDGSANFGAFEPAVAYDGVDNEYLVVWEGDDNTGTLVDDEREIFGQRLNAGTGAALGVNDFRISDTGPDGNVHFTATAASVAYSGVAGEYLVVWQGDEVVAEELEIYGQRISGGTGSALGVNDFRISQMGPDTDGEYDAFTPAVAVNRFNKETLVVWTGDDNTPPLVNDELEVFGQRLKPDATTSAPASAPAPPPAVSAVVPRLRALLRAVRTGSRRSLFVVILYADTGTEKQRFRSPLQGPAYLAIRATLLDGDRGGGAVLLTGRRGVRTIQRLVTL